MNDHEYVVYCKTCKAILIDYKERMIEYHSFYRYWSEDGKLTTGETEFIEAHGDGGHKPECTICNKETPYYVKLEKEVFILILKSCYRRSKDRDRHIDKGFVIELKHKEEPDSVQMITPTLQEVKEAITENNV